MTMEEIKERREAMLDSWLGKVTSRKLMVWVAATALMAFGMVESADWVMISGLYIGGQSVIDAIAKMKGA